LVARHVRPGAEPPARSREDDDARLPLGSYLGKRVAHVPHHAIGECVVAIGVVEGELDDTAVQIVAGDGHQSNEGVFVSRPDRSRVPARADVSSPLLTMGAPLTSTCSMPFAPPYRRPAPPGRSKRMLTSSLATFAGSSTTTS